MPWRAIQDTVGTSESLAGLSDRGERIWWRILAHSDPWGRLDARPRKLRALCYPMLLEITDEDAGHCLIELEQAGRIVVWEKAGSHTLQIIDFEENQPREAFRKRAATSRFPTPPSSLKPVENLVASLYSPDSENLPGNGGKDATPQGFPESFRNQAGKLPDQRRGEETRREETEIFIPKAVTSTYNPDHEHAETNGPGIDIDQVQDLLTATTATLRSP